MRLLNHGLGPLDTERTERIQSLDSTRFEDLAEVFGEPCTPLMAIVLDNASMPHEIGSEPVGQLVYNYRRVII